MMKYTGKRKVACYMGFPVENPTLSTAQAQATGIWQDTVSALGRDTQRIHTIGFAPVEEYEIPSHLSTRV